MSESLLAVPKPPEWLQAFSDAIDTLDFERGFEPVDEATTWAFGVKIDVGRRSLETFFHQIDDDLDTTHRLLETWSGDTVHIVKGEADVAPKGTGEATTTTPFIWILRLDPGEPFRISDVFIVNGPINTDSVL